ncbi:glycerol-3-phosphate acyltransferase [Moraxella macacae 0408225]|uniref:Glycerol-3-phosphate acyltransferase n=1 Tax=Moraxella macacae 0408225 TaxID=1230338 RepID=L2F9K2_9GAMM|nr:glycerol-3-phosphate 1-O-acyltransferase PlsB [Moraxella macacae]ELA09143.1 glycerol-3-phosphate acyltransferase [Moraxella macacae 0408225]
MTHKTTPFQLNNLYRKLSGGLLGMAVKSQLIGKIPPLKNPTTNNHETATPLTFYVLKEYSRSNSVLIDLETAQHQLPEALAPVKRLEFGIDEHSAMIFIHHPKSERKDGKTVYSPRLLRLIEAIKNHPTLNIQFVPVTILWGRAPEKEDSLFNLFTADEWQNPSIAKQLFNIGVKGRDTYVQFHPPKNLRDILHAESKAQSADSNKNTALIDNHSALQLLAQRVQNRLLGYLDKQQETILGPDLSDRRNEVDKILNTPAIRHAIQLDSEEHNRNIHDSKKLARRYLNEITSDYSYAMVRFFDRFLTWLWTQLYDGVKVQHFERVREAASDHAIVYVPCHRSHIDYLLLSYVIFKRGLRVPYVAAGENLNIPILGQMLRNGGAFFMRRSFKGNALYNAVFREYVHSMLLRNTPIEYFVEGGRSRSGRLLPPKKGMLAMTVQSHLRQSSKPIAFIPTYIGYERIIEGSTYVDELKGKPKESESLFGLLKTGKKLERIFGTVHVSFGKPLYLKDFMQKYAVLPNSLPSDRSDTPIPPNVSQMVDNIGVKIMQRINRSAVINPVTLLSMVLLDTPHGALDEQSCLEQLALYQRLAKTLPYDEDITVTDARPQAIIAYSTQLKLIEKTPHVLGDLIRIANGQAPLLSYFRNNILHVYILFSLCANLVKHNGHITFANVEQVASTIYPFLQAELFLQYPARTLQETLTQHIEVLIAENIIVDKGVNAKGERQLTTPDPNTHNYQQLTVLANAVSHSLERYFMVLALLSQQGSNKLTKEQVVDLGHLLGQRLSVIYEDDMPDFFDRALFSSFLETLERLEYIQPTENGIIQFDNRIDIMAKNADFILDLDVLHILHQMARLDESEIQRTLHQLQAKKSKRKNK